MMPGATFLAVVTFYSLGCDAPGPLTKAQTTPVAGHVVAADPRVLPLGSIIHIEGFGQRQVQDVGGKVKGRHVDVYMSSCAEAWEMARRGPKRRQVRVLHVGGRKPR